MHQFIDYQGINVSVTICDRDAIVLYQNSQSKNIFGNVVGNSLFECHPKHACDKIRELLSTCGTNAYTISKNGRKKMIYQTPWFDENGELQGLIEYSMIIPDDMPHYIRS